MFGNSPVILVRKNIRNRKLLYVLSLKKLVYYFF